MKKGPTLFRVALEVKGLEKARRFYGRLLGMKGRRVGGGRHYFDCGEVIVSLVDVARPKAGPQDLYFAVSAVEAFHRRARALRCLSKEAVHGDSGGALVRRTWGERSFYAEDPFGNGLCFVDRKTLFTGE